MIDVQAVTLRFHCVVGALFLLSCAGRAVRADTPAAYRAQLAGTPTEEEARHAQERLAALEFAQASRAHSVLAYKRFLEEFPDAADAAAARSLLEGLRFNAARARDNAASYRQFLIEHPQGPRAEEARARLAELDATQGIALAPGDPSARPLEAEQARELQALKTARQQGPRALFQYLADFPDSAHREPAQVELLRWKLEGLLVSGEFDEAHAVKQGSPLGAKLSGWKERALELEALRHRQARSVPTTQAAHYLRDRKELVEALSALDPRERWEAAQELGHHVSVKSLDPLLETVRGARNLLVRQRAFESLSTLLAALPAGVAEYEREERLRPLMLSAADDERVLERAVLLELGGQVAAAAAEYGQVFQSQAPDPFLLWRLIQLREGRKEHFSAGVAARQLALWASTSTENAEPSGEVGVARRLCAAAEAARFSLATLDQARKHVTDFPEDLVAFEREARHAERKVEARLKDHELALRTARPHARLCGESEVTERILDGERSRLQALGELSRKDPRLAVALLTYTKTSDPSAKVRQRAAALLEEVGVR